MSVFAELRGAARALEPERVIAALDRTFAAWREPGSPWRERLARELPLYSREVLDRGLREGLGDWTARALAELRAREAADPHRAPRLTAVWLAATVPTGVFSALALPLLAGSAVYAKPSSSDRASPELFARSLEAADAGVGAALRLGGDDAALTEADAVVAYGSDETVGALRQRVPPDRIFMGHGHKLSVAAIGTDLSVGEAAERAALDLALFDGRGCLSPSYIVALERPAGRSAALAAALAEALAREAERLPRGRLSDAEHLALRELRSRWALLAGGKTWLPGPATDWGVLLAPPRSLPPPGIFRHVAVVPVADAEGLREWCARLSPHLSSLGVAGFGGMDALIPSALAGGGSRICALGRMQFPPIGWRQDGAGAITPLLRFADVETETTRDPGEGQA